MKDFDSKCEIKQVKISCQENGRKYIGDNPKKHDVYLYHIDSADFLCLFGDNLKCDYLLLEDEIKAAIFIELKGKRVSHAVDQLESTERILKPYLKEYAEKYFRIVASNVRGPEVNKDNVRKFKSKHPGRVACQTNQLEEDINAPLKTVLK